MDRTKLESLIDTYIEKCVRPAAEKKQVRNLLLGENRGSFIARWEDLDGDYHSAIKDSVMSLTTDKSAAIKRYNLFIQWLQKNSKEDIRVKWPPIDVSSRIDRLVYIMRTLHEKPRNIAAWLSDKLWMSERTIEDDLSSIQYDVAIDNNFLNQSFQINGIARANGSIHFLSSVHPMLLMENLTSVVVMLQALLEKARNPACKEWAMLTACHAWNQLTDYAKGHVTRVMNEAYPQGGSVRLLFDELRKMRAEDSFRTEEDIRREAASQLMYCWKAGLPCKVTCREKDGSITEYHGVPLTECLNQDSVRIRLASGDEITLSFDIIISSQAIQDEAGLQ